MDASEVSADFAHVQARKDEIIKRFRSGSTNGENRAGVELVMRHGRFTGPRTVQVTIEGGTTREVHAPLVFINTGTRPARPSLPGTCEVGARGCTVLLNRAELPVPFAT